MAGIRDKVYFQIHFGANYETGTYGWTTNLDTVNRSVDWQLKALRSGYIDFGFIHCIDESADLQEVEKAGIIRYIEKLKEQGVVRHIGLSSHTPQLVNEVLDMGAVAKGFTGDQIAKIMKDNKRERFVMYFLQHSLSWERKKQSVTGRKAAVLI